MAPRRAQSQRLDYRTRSLRINHYGRYEPQVPPDHSLEGLEATMHVEEALEGSEIIVLAVPSSVILNVVEDIIPHLDQDTFC